MTTQQLEIPEDVLDRLARGVASMASTIMDYYKDPKNEADYQKWLAERQKGETKHG